MVITQDGDTALDCARKGQEDGAGDAKSTGPAIIALVTKAGGAAEVVIACADVLWCLVCSGAVYHSILKHSKHRCFIPFA